jgi:ADP-heptose:LPS heptosyltransferase
VTPPHAPDRGRTSSDRGPVGGVRKIAVLRANTALGDLVLALPALEALRDAYPEAELVLLGAGWHPPFLLGRPSPVDRVVVVPPIRGIRDERDLAEDPEELAGFFADMRAERFGLAIQLQGGGRHANDFLQRLGAGLTAGLKAADAPAPDRWVPYVSTQFEVLRFLEVVSLVGVRACGVEPRLAVTGADLAEARAVVPVANAPLVALHPGAGTPRRRWPAEKFAAVGDALARAGARVVVTGGAQEHALAREVIGAMEADAEDLTGRLSLGGLAGLLSRCAVLVANDSGPAHLAVAVGAATVGIYWCGNFINWAPLTRFRHRPAISWRVTCPGCGRDTIREPCPYHDDSLVDDVTTAEVIASALELLGAAAHAATDRRG